MLELKEIYKTFNRGTITEKKAISGVDLKLNEGDFVTVIGGNGAGKSTLLNLIAGVYEADYGRILLDDIDITYKKEHTRAGLFGRVFQDPMTGTASNMGIEENLALAKRKGNPRTLKWGITRAERSEYIEKLKRLDLGLEKRLNSKVGLLSGGQRQALTLDPKTAKRVLELTEEIISEDKLTAFMVTHNIKDAIHYGNRLIMMNDGRIIYDVSGEEKKSLEISDLLKKFENEENALSDKLLLS